MIILINKTRNIYIIFNTLSQNHNLLTTDISQWRIRGGGVIRQRVEADLFFPIY